MAKQFVDERKNPAAIFQPVPGGRIDVDIEATANRSAILWDTTTNPSEGNREGAVLLFCDVATYIRFGNSSVVADATDFKLRPGFYMPWRIDPTNAYVSTLKVNGGDSDGILEIAKLR